MKIPEKVKEAAKYYTSNLRLDIVYLGRENENVYYTIDYHGGKFGFPVVFRLVGDNVEILGPVESLKLVSRFC